MTKPKLLIVGAFPLENSQIVGGVVTVCRILMESDLRNHFDLVLIDSTQKSNPPPRFAIRLFSALQRTIRYLSALVREKPDAVILFSSLGASLAEKSMLAWLTRIKKIPVFIFPRGAKLITIVEDKPWQKLWVIPAMRGATHFLCQGPTWQRFAVEVVRFNVNKTEIIYNWTATPELLKIGSQKKEFSGSNKLEILFLGWLEVEKGIFELLDACLALSKKYQFKLLIAGKGHAEDNARKFVAEHKLESFVEFLGWTHDSDKSELLSKVDMLALPSWAEGFPNAVIEAMAAKIAVVVTSVGNIPDILTDREQVLIIPPKNTESLTDAIEELLTDTMFRQRLASRGYLFAKENFSTEVGVARLIDIVNKAIREN